MESSSSSCHIGSHQGHQSWGRGTCVPAVPALIWAVSCACEAGVENTNGGQKFSVTFRSWKWAGFDLVVLHPHLEHLSCVAWSTVLLETPVEVGWTMPEQKAVSSPEYLHLAWIMRPTAWLEHPCIVPFNAALQSFQWSKVKGASLFKLSMAKVQMRFHQ